MTTRETYSYAPNDDADWSIPFLRRVGVPCLLTIPLYIISLAGASCLAGVFVRRLLAAQGFVPDFDTGLMLAAGAALAYMAVQLLYMSFFRFVTPSRSPVSMTAESLSQLSALLLAPFFLGIPIPWPDLGSETLTRLLTKVEPILYLAGFFALHVLFKIISLFGATQSRPATRIPAIIWAGGAVLCFLGAVQALGLWQSALVEARIRSVAETRWLKAGDAWAEGREMLEGYFYPIDFSPMANEGSVLLVARPPQSQELETVSLAIRFAGSNEPPAFFECSLDAEGWAEVPIPAGYFPAEQTQAQIRWSRTAGNALLARAGLQPVQGSDEVLVLSGPHPRKTVQASGPPNILVLQLDGVSAEHLKSLDYDREATPHIDAFALEGLHFRYAYTPTPEARGAAMTIFTGMSPLAHGQFGARSAALPEQVQLLPELLRDLGYRTIAFSEGENGGHLTAQSPFSRGFERFDDSYPFLAASRDRSAVLPGGVEPPSPKRTLDKVQRFIEAASDQQHFVFVRLREMEAVRQLARHSTPFPTGRSTRLPIDVYDNGLHSLDSDLQSFFAALEESNYLDNAVVFITSSFGHSFEGDGEGVTNLDEEALRIPLILRGRGIPARQRLGLVGLEDVAPTILKMAGAEFPYPVTGEPLLDWGAKDRIAVQGDPLQLSLRTQDWRFTWQSGRGAQDFDAISMAQPLALINMDRYRLGRSQENYLATEETLVETFTRRLETYLEGLANRMSAAPPLPPSPSP